MARSRGESEGEEEEFTVEQILDKHIRNSKVKYLIKWEGYPDTENTWELQENLNCPNIISAYEERSQKKKEEKKRKKEAESSGDKKKQMVVEEEENKPSGFDRGLQPERIIGATDSSGHEDPTSASFKDCELSSAAEIARRLSDDSRYRSMVSKSIELSDDESGSPASNSPASNSSISLVFASTPKDVQINVRRWLTHAAAEGMPKTSKSRTKILNYGTPAYVGPRLKRESLKFLLKDPLKRDSQYYAKDSPGTRHLSERNVAGHPAETFIVGGVKRKMPAEVMNEDEEKWVDVNPKQRVSDRKQMAVKWKQRDGDHEFKGADQRLSQASSKAMACVTPSLFSDDEDLINLLTDNEDEGNRVEIDLSSRKGSWREVDKKKNFFEEVGLRNSVHNAGDFLDESQREGARGNVCAGFARLDAEREKSKKAPEEDSLEDLGEVEILKDWQKRKVADHEKRYKCGTNKSESAGEAKAQRTDRDKHQEVLLWILNGLEFGEAVKKICNQEE